RALQAEPAVGRSGDPQDLRVVDTCRRRGGRTRGRAAHPDVPSRDAARRAPLASDPTGDPVLSPGAHRITDADLKALPASLVGGPVADSSANAYEAIEKLRRIYCSTTGFDYAHVFVP